MYKVGDTVRVIKKVSCWNSPNGWTCQVAWAMDGDAAIGHLFKIKEVRYNKISKVVDYRLNTRGQYGMRYNWLFPPESLQAATPIGTQLLFPFMGDS